jgi:hypothetical protein
LKESEQKWGINLSLFMPGLFTFYQFAKLELKLKFNKIMKKYVVPIGYELLSCLNGFITTMLIGLEDQNDECLKGIDEIIQSTIQQLGNRKVFGAIWLVFSILLSFKL